MKWNFNDYSLDSPKDCPRKRLDAVYDLCKGKTICEGGGDLDKDEKSQLPDDEAEPKVNFRFFKGFGNLSGLCYFGHC